MPKQKTILTIQVDNENYDVQYSGGFNREWDQLSPKDRKAMLRHDSRILNVLIDCPDLYDLLAGFVRAVERYKRREAKRAKQAAETPSPVTRHP